MQYEIDIKTADGMAKGMIVKPQDGSTPDKGVIIYMDAFGPREALHWMGERIAERGYTVLVPDLYYRSGTYGPFDARTAFTQEDTGNQIRALMKATGQALTARDGEAFIAALTGEGVSGAIGAVGYCMGGGRAITAAAHYPERIKAAASFHGGNLAGDAEDSPHRLADRIKARIYVGVAGVDNSFPPEQSARFAEAFRIGGVDHTVENYIGMAHGWTVPDHGVYDREGSERHFKRLLTLFEETL